MFTEGYYLYIETTGHKIGDTAKLVSPKINGAAKQCFTFWYHMYGDHVDTLNVYFAKGRVVGDPVWTRNGTHGNKWLMGRVQINGGSASSAVTNVSTRCFCFINKQLID